MSHIKNIIVLDKLLGDVLPGEIQVYWKDVDDERYTFTAHDDDVEGMLCSVVKWIDVFKKNKLKRQMECIR